MEALSLGMNVGGTVMSLMGGQNAADAQRRAGQAKGMGLEFEAGQYDQIAGQERATSQRAAAEERRKGRLVASRALAVGAASGGGVDSGLSEILGDIASEGEYRFLTQLYTGESRARSAENRAKGKRWEAGEARVAGDIAGDATEMESYGKAFGKFGTFLSGNRSMFQRYG